MILFVGLGNPTNKYENTRHNIGFKVIDYVVNNLKANYISKSKFNGDLYKKDDLLFLKPTTYMNLSGNSVKEVVNFYKPDRVIVIHDDTELKFGAVKLKIGGGNGGHNGLKSIDAMIGQSYERLRLGIGRDDGDLASYVLSNFTKEQTQCLEKIILHAYKILIALSEKPLSEIQAEFSSKKGLCQ